MWFADRLFALRRLHSSGERADCGSHCLRLLQASACIYKYIYFINMVDYQRLNLGCDEVLSITLNTIKYSNNTYII